jgi:hypothetical protein
MAITDLTAAAGSTTGTPDTVAAGVEATTAPAGTGAALLGAAIGAGPTEGAAEFEPEETLLWAKEDAANGRKAASVKTRKLWVDMMGEIVTPGSLLWRIYCDQTGEHRREGFAGRSRGEHMVMASTTLCSQNDF